MREKRLQRANVESREEQNQAPHLPMFRHVRALLRLKKHVGAALAAIHREPARRWTVAMLALEVGLSRAGFAARFRQLVGNGPIGYLARWRMLLAGRSLSRGEPVGAIARSLGYESESAFSTAFKRVMGSRPRHHARLTGLAIRG